VLSDSSTVPAFVNAPVTASVPPQLNVRLLPALLVTLAKVTAGSPLPLFPIARVGVEPEPPKVTAPAFIPSFPIVTV
jgi:hypothetical protein